MSGIGEKEQENSSTGTESLRFKCLGARIGLRRSFLRLRQPTIALPTSEKVDSRPKRTRLFFSRPSLLESSPSLQFPLRHSNEQIVPP